MPAVSGVVMRYIIFVCLSALNVAEALVGLDLNYGLKNYSFPEEFILGVATSAFQIEGGWNEGGRGESVWDTLLHKNPSFTPDKSNGDIACDSYHNYMEDVAMVKYLGVKYYRLSISWPRILPNGYDNYINYEGVRYYRKLFKALLAADITPVVTLYHWDLPTPLMDLGGWNNPKIVDYFEDYSRVAFKVFGDLVKIWSTVNEPHQHCYNGYGSDYFAPAIKANGIGEYLCSHYILLGHARAYHLYDREFRPTQQGKIGLTLDSFWMVPKNANNPDDIEASEKYLQIHLGLYAHPIFSKNGNYPALLRDTIDSMSLKQNFTRSRLPYFTEEEVNSLRGSSDFFGLNHYTSFLASPSKFESNWRVPSMDHDTGAKLEQDPNWLIPGAEWLAFHPTGFRKLLNWVTREYGREIPIIVTENGSSDFGGIADYDRVSYYNTYLYQLLLALHEDKCNIVGYFAWTLMDDFEWTDGYTSKFGLFHVDFNDPKRKRTPKLSAENYKEIVRRRSLDFNYIVRPSHKKHYNGV